MRTARRDDRKSVGSPKVACAPADASAPQQAAVRAHAAVRQHSRLGCRGCPM